jgi:hypothetical protein
MEKSNKDSAASPFGFDVLLHRLHTFCAARGKVLMAMIATAMLAMTIVAIQVVPARLSEGKELVALAHKGEQIKNATVNMQRELNEQQAKLKEVRERPQKVINQALNAGGYSERDLAYWRKQMMAFGLIKQMRLMIIGRSTSKFANATALTIELSAVGSTPLSGLQIASALDFLQLYGYLESFDGKKAVVHVPAPENDEGKDKP